MSIRFDAAGDLLTNTTGILNYNSPYTLMGWVIVVVDLNAISCFFGIHDGTSNNRDLLSTTNTGTLLRNHVVVGGVAANVSGTDMSVGVWHHLALVRESTTSLKVYLDGALDSTNTTSVAARGAGTTMAIGGSNSPNLPYSGSVFAFKAWSAALALADVQQEMRIVRPNQLANLYGFWPMRPGSGERTRDYSGNGHTWTEGGTLTDENSPPVGWGAPQSARWRAPVAGPPPPPSPMPRIMSAIYR